jgi:hypothetical protein
MAELAAAIISAIMWIGKTAYDQTVRVYTRSHDELERIRDIGARNLRRTVGCPDPESDSDDEEEPVKVDEKKPPLALMVIGAAVLAHVVRQGARRGST